MHTTEQIDWSESSLVECKPSVLRGATVLLGTRMPADAIVDNYDYGMPLEEIAEQFELPADQVQAVLAYAEGHRVAHLL